MKKNLRCSPILLLFVACFISFVQTKYECIYHELPIEVISKLYPETQQELPESWLIKSLGRGRGGKKKFPKGKL